MANGEGLRTLTAVNMTGPGARSAISRVRQQHGQQGRTDRLEQQHYCQEVQGERTSSGQDSAGRATGEDWNQQWQRACRSSNSLALQTDGGMPVPHGRTSGDTGECSGGVKAGGYGTGCGKGDKGAAEKTQEQVISEASMGKDTTVVSVKNGKFFLKKSPYSLS